MNTTRIIAIPTLVIALIICLATGCKKDKIEVKQTQVFAAPADPAASYVPSYNTFHLTLEPGGSADVLPGGDISYRGTYKISGSKIKVKTEQDGKSYTFEIISKTEIKESQYGTRLFLKE